MTPYVKPDYKRMLRNISKVKTLAQSARVTGVLLTGKGEPTMNEKALFRFIKEFREWPVEVQTNGYKIDNASFSDKLYKSGLDTIAVSVSSSDAFEKIRHGVSYAASIGLNVRLTINLTSSVLSFISAEHRLGDILSFARKYKASQVTFRKITRPQNLHIRKIGAYNANFCEDKKVRSAKNYVDNFSKSNAEAINNFEQYLSRELKHNGVRIRTLAWDNSIYDLQGIGILHSDYCIQESNNSEDVRSLIFNQDGHVYTSWNSQASIIF
jgi:hypothetical protein